MRKDLNTACLSTTNCRVLTNFYGFVAQNCHPKRWPRRCTSYAS